MYRSVLLAEKREREELCVLRVLCGEILSIKRLEKVS